MSVSTIGAGTSTNETALAAWLRFRPQISGENLVLLSALYFSLFSNGAFWQAAIADPLPQWRLCCHCFW